MSGRSRSYKEGLHRRLQHNTEALQYLQAALEDSRAAFLVALRNVVDARNLVEVARASKLNREHLYRMLAGQGNPTVASLEKVLHALGLRLSVALENGGRTDDSAAETEGRGNRAGQHTYSPAPAFPPPPRPTAPANSAPAPGLSQEQRRTQLSKCDCPDELRSIA